MPPRSAWLRRAISIPALVLATGVLTSLSPLLLVLALALDLGRGTAAVRMVLFLVGFLWSECLALPGMALGALVAPRGEAMVRWNRSLQARWVRQLSWLLERIYGLRFVVEHGDPVDRGPMLLFLRHASTADTILPVLLVAIPHDLGLRYVLKEELAWDPALDIVGHRLPNVFVRRGSGSPELEAQRVGALARDLGPRDGVAFFPEGTRFSARRRQARIDRLRAEGRSTEVEEALGHTLRPRTRGAFALLDAAPDADVVFCAHRGLEQVRSLADLLGGAFIDLEVRVRFWRVSSMDIPTDEAGREAWLLAWWQRLDDWVGSTGRPGAQAAEPTSPAPPA